ncbi:MAG TPA: hypothetical protein VIM57_03720 [Luteolibacter sp.]
MITLTPPPHIQAAISAACAAEDERLMRSPVKATQGASRTQADDRSFKHAYQVALALAQRIGLTVPFDYNGVECFATPDDSWKGV